MRETKEKHIGRYLYRVNQLGAREGGRALVRLLKLVGSAAGGAQAGGIGGAIERVADRITEADFDWLVDTFAKHTEVIVGGKRPQLIDVFDSHFVGHYAEMMQWVKFALETNYGDVFLEWFGTSLNGAPVQTTSQSTSPDISEMTG